MSELIESKLRKIPVIKQFVVFTKQIKFKSIVEGLSLYDVLELYILGIFKGAFSYRASAIAFSFFMALFPFALFILNLIPFIPIANFQNDFIVFIGQNVPPNTFDAIELIIRDILNNSYQGLLSSGFILSIFLMTNGVNAILGGFEMSEHITITRGYFKQYIISLALSLILSMLLIVTVAAIIVFEIFIQKIKIQDFLSDSISIIQWGRYVFVVLMILITTAMLYKYGTKETTQISFFSYGAFFTTLLIILSSYVFGIYVEKFARYNELYGSIGTLLVLMFYIWINCMVLLLGFELNAAINKLKRKNLYL